MEVAEGGGHGGRWLSQKEKMNGERKGKEMTSWHMTCEAYCHMDKTTWENSRGRKKFGFRR